MSREGEKARLDAVAVCDLPKSHAFGGGTIVGRPHEPGREPTPDVLVDREDGLGLRAITLDDHQNSRWIVEPVLRLLDCCQESDVGVAILVNMWGVLWIYQFAPQQLFGWTWVSF